MIALLQIKKKDFKIRLDDVNAEEIHTGINTDIINEGLVLTEEITYSIFETYSECIG